MPLQSDWRLCTECNAIFYDGTSHSHATRGRCAATDAGHTPAGFTFQLEHDVPEAADWQGHGRLCLHCHALVFFGYGPRPAGCPGNPAGHEGAGHVFALSNTGAEDAGHQRDWEFCAKCSALFWNGYGGGVCALSGTHVMAPEAYHFVLSHEGSAGPPNGSHLRLRAHREPITTRDGGGGRERRSAGMALTGFAYAPPPLHGGWSRCVP